MITCLSQFQNPKYREMLIFARETLGLSKSISINISPLGKRGSDRTFFRLKWNDVHSVILMHYDPIRLENTFYADILKFLHHLRLPVPKLIGHDSLRFFILMEDLGDTDLFSLKKTSWKIRRDLYQKILSLIYRLHSFPLNHFLLKDLKLMEGFGPDLYRWEQNYFKEYFVKGICKIKLEPSFEKELGVELSALIQCLIGFPNSLIHRDLQSQNVMIREGEVFFIDFQGMRPGIPLYDLGSLLCDPYTTLSDKERNELLLFSFNLWCSEKKGSTRLKEWKIFSDWDTFQEMFWKASTQRLMQALGAYGFLGLKKDLKTYFNYIPSGLTNIYLATSQVSSLPRLRELCRLCQEQISQ